MQKNNGNWIRLGIALGILIFSYGDLNADTVAPKVGRSFRGKVSKMTANSVTLTLTSGKDQIFNAGDLKQVIFDGEPTGLRNARRNVADGQYNRVEETLAAVSPADKYQAMEKEYLLAVSSAMLALRGESGKTIAGSVTTLEAYAAKRENKFWYQYFHALEVLGDIQVAANQLDKAATQFSTMLSKSSSDEIKLKGQFKLGHVKALQGKFAEAKTAFDSVMVNKSNEVEAVKTKLLAKVNAARCDAELGKAKEGIQTILTLIKKEDPGNMQLFGQAYNALGHCYLNDGQNKAALLAFLHTDVLYQRDPDTHSAALFQLIQLWQKDQKPSQSLESRRLLREKYRNTFWGNKELSSN